MRERRSTTTTNTNMPADAFEQAIADTPTS